MTQQTKPILTITGSDPTGGSGIQADIKTITALGGYAVSAITSVTVQLMETCQVKLVNQAIDQTHRVVFRNIFINSLRKKQNLLGSVRTEVYLCHAF